MIDKLLIIGCIVLAIVAAVFGGLSYSRGLKIDALHADNALIQSKLDSSNADLEISNKNHNRIVEEKDRLLASMMAQADAEREAAVQMARINKDVDNAKDGKACTDSDPMRVMLDGLRIEQERASRGRSADDRVPAAGPTRKAVGVP